MCLCIYVCVCECVLVMKINLSKVLQYLCDFGHDHGRSHVDRLGRLQQAPAQGILLRLFSDGVGLGFNCGGCVCFPLLLLLLLNDGWSPCRAARVRVPNGNA